ncbi:MAG: hypothetical protein ACREDP_20305, partial [Bradyrhizobium sp.]
MKDELFGTEAAPHRTSRCQPSVVISIQQAGDRVGGGSSSLLVHAAPLRRGIRMAAHRLAHFLIFALAGSIALTGSSWAGGSSEEPSKGDFLAKLSGLPQLSVDAADQAAVYVDSEGNATSIIGDAYFTTARKSHAFLVSVRKCEGDGNPPVWLRYYDGPNMFAKGTFTEISFDMPVPVGGLPEIFNQQSLWDQMSILQPEPVFSDLSPTFCGFSSSKTVWANGGFNFEVVAGNSAFDVGDASPTMAWNSPWNDAFNDTPYRGFTSYPIMSIGNGAGGLPAGYAFRTKGGTTDDTTDPASFVHARYTLLIDQKTVILELTYKGAKSTYAVPQKLFIDKFLPKVIGSGYMAADDKQVAQVQNFIWRWMLFTNTLTIQKPAAPDGKPIEIGDLPKYFPKTSSYTNIQSRVSGFDGVNNPAAFDNTLICGQGFELYGTLFGNRAFFAVDDYTKWLAADADKSDARYPLWRCVAAIAKSRQNRCVSSGSESNPAGKSWNVVMGYMNDAYP